MSIASVHVKAVFVIARMRNEVMVRSKHPKTIKNILQQEDNKF